MKGNKKFYDPSIHVRISRNGRRAFSSIYIHSQNFMVIIFMLEFQEMAGEHLHVNVFIQEVMYLYT